MHGCSAGRFVGCQSAVMALCGCCSASVAMRDVMALLDARVQGCTLGILLAIKAQWRFFAASAAPVLPYVRWRLFLMRARKAAALGVS
jgi:hypothetical protein